MGADEPMGAGWWIASDNKWYPPELHPDRVSLPRVAAQPVTVLVDSRVSQEGSEASESASSSASVSANVLAGPAGRAATSGERAQKLTPKWESDAKSQIGAALKKYSKPLSDLVSRDANEGDTRLLVTDFLCDALGYDKYEELTTEYQVKGEFADYGVRIDKQLVAFIEVKRCTTKLNDKHLRQVQSYAVNEGVEWLILTNGQVWQVWHLTGGLPVSLDLVIEVDLLLPEPAQVKIDDIFHLAKPAMKRQTMVGVWQTKKATSPASLARALLSASVLDAVRKEVRRQTDHNPSVGDIEEILRSRVLRPDCV